MYRLLKTLQIVYVGNAMLYCIYRYVFFDEMECDSHAYW